jgi:hypothetical protein
LFQNLQREIFKIHIDIVTAIKGPERYIFYKDRMLQAPNIPFLSFGDLLIKTK